MFRRKFLTGMTMAGAGSLAAFGAASASATRMVTYRIRGFSCVTCAVGLDTMLGQQKGVVRSKSSYADSTSIIEFHPELVDEKSLKAFIAGMGFTAEETGHGSK